MSKGEINQKEVEELSEEKVALGIHDTRIESLEKKVDKLEDNGNLLYKLSVILETQVETNKIQGKQLNRMEIAFQDINTNLTNLNNSQLALKESVDKVNNRVDKIEVAVEENTNRDKISISEHLKKWATWILFGLPTAIIVGYFMMKLGL